jgi:hypothetical protein
VVSTAPKQVAQHGVTLCGTAVLQVAMAFIHAWLPCRRVAIFLRQRNAVIVVVVFLKQQVLANLPAPSTRVVFHICTLQMAHSAVGVLRSMQEQNLCVMLHAIVKDTATRRQSSVHGP